MFSVFSPFNLNLNQGFQRQELNLTEEHLQLFIAAAPPLLWIHLLNRWHQSFCSIFSVSPGPSADCCRWSLMELSWMLQQLLFPGSAGGSELHEVKNYNMNTWWTEELIKSEQTVLHLERSKCLHPCQIWRKNESCFVFDQMEMLLQGPGFCCWGCFTGGGGEEQADLSSRCLKSSTDQTDSGSRLQLWPGPLVVSVVHRAMQLRGGPQRSERHHHVLPEP